MLNTQEDRINRLNQKLKKIDINDREGRLTKLTAIDQKVTALEAKFEQMRQQQESESKVVRHQASRLAQDVEESDEHWQANYNVEKLVEAVTLLAQKVEMLAENNRQGDQRLVRVIEEKARTLKGEFGKERKLRSEQLEDLCSLIKDTLPRLEDLVTEEAQRRLEADETILKKLNQETADLDLELSKEKACKEENEKAIFDIIKDTVEKVKRELETEKKDRENSEQSLMRLLEDSMSKLNSIVHA
jgi:hypothetical protein